MPLLVIDQPGVPPISLPLTGQTVHLGRAEDNDVPLVADEVSRHHAKLVFRGGRYVLYDLESLNGTYVNRQRIVERVLAEDDELFLGSKCRLEFRADGPGQAPSAPVGNRAQRPPADPRRQSAPTPQGMPGAAPQEPSQSDSALAQDLDRIRENMERVGNTMTLIGKVGMTPPPGSLPDAETPSPDEVDMVAMGRAFRRLEALYKATKLIASEFDLDNRLSAVLDTAMEVVEAERGFVMLRDEATGGLRMHVARAMGQDVKAGSPSMTVAGRAAIHGEPVLMSDRDNDSRFAGSESIIMQQIRSAMAVPLRVEDRILGSIYVDTRSLANPFQEEDLEMFASFAAQSAMAIENVRLYEQMVDAEKRRANLGRFLSPSIVEAIMDEHQEMELGGTKRTVTTLFSDIRGFTSIAEKLTPEDLIEMLNEHFTASTETVFLNEGTLDKYIGDCVMAVFGSPFERPDDALRCVRAAMGMMKRNEELNEIRAVENRPVLEIGIGIDTGEVNSGLMGSPDRLEFTVVGDSVNTASRLCSKAESGEVLIGERTYALVKDSITATPMGTSRLKGKEAGVQVYRVESINE